MEEEDQHIHTIRTWNQLAELYEARFMDIPLYNATYDRFCELLLPGSSVLELGCGPGNITRYLLHSKQDLHISATDAAPRMVELAKKNNPTANCFVLDARRITTLEKKFDAVVAGFCLPYIAHEDFPRFISDVYDRLNDGGIFYLSFVEGRPEDSSYQTGSTGDRIWFNYYDSDALIHQSKKAGFKPETKWRLPFSREGKPDEIHTVLIFSKKK